jgi:DNA-binding MarR family transcriptional regulator
MGNDLAGTPYSQAPEPFLRTMRALAECYQAVFRVDSRHVETLGLTAAQFDVLATLGDTAGMTCKQLGAGTLITKGTLTGVLDRLEQRGLIQRTKGEHDSRQVFVTLTAAGEAVFRQTFQPHVDYMGRFFQGLDPARQQQLRALLGEVQQAFQTEVTRGQSSGES